MNIIVNLERNLNYLQVLMATILHGLSLIKIKSPTFKNFAIMVMLFFYYPFNYKIIM